MRPEHVSRIIRTAVKRAGIQEKMYEDRERRTRWKITSHTLRRSAASYLANKTGYPLHMLASDLNHRSVDTTGDRYVREDKVYFTYLSMVDFSETNISKTHRR
ncbi:tyrosine-type recombinase/integrase [Haloquadratum walsbyi]|uniref:tyrosine-type recombinase/integrase n=1 Tax=Haloquadratum walsbyi TaxID=293091 RepID=UPI00067793E9